VRRGLRERLALMLVVGGIAAAIPAVVHVTVGQTGVNLTAKVHFYSVGFSALVAALAALGLTAMGARRGDTRTVVVGTAFAVMASLLALHGLSTPGVWFGNNGVISITGGATLPAGAVILALSVLPLPPALRSVKALLALQVVLLAFVIGLGVSALAWPGLLPTVPAPNSEPALALLAVGLVAYGLLIWRALRTFLLTQRALDLVVVIGLVWLATALVPALTMDFTRLGWWIGHEVELDGILIVGIAVAVDLARAAQSRPLAGDLRGADLVASEDAFLGSHVRALMVRLADKDEYTERHTRRVALRAVQVGEELGLSASRLRTLAIGALVHDIGKLSVPDAILKKPGPLDDEEYAVIKEHPERGYRLLNELGGFSDSARPRREPDRSRHADPHRLRRLRRAHLEARVPGRVGARRGDGAAPPRDRRRLRRALCRGARTGRCGRQPRARRARLAGGAQRARAGRVASLGTAGNAGV
jgi:hypothetical protein